MRNGLGLLAALLSAAACGSSAPPPGARQPPSSPPIVSVPADAPADARFLTVSMRKPARVEAGICDIVFAYVATGQVEAYAETLAQGDVLMVKGPDPFDLSGSGGVVLFTIRKPCAARTGHGPIIAVVREISAPELSWDGGAMRVRMVIDKNASPEAYLGLLEGSSAIHDHELASWEVLSVVDGVGTLTVGGRPLHLVAGSVVAIPPNTKQSWTPDPDTKLIAVQMFFPAGPEERYRELAAQAAHGAPPPAPQVTPP